MPTATKLKSTDEVQPDPDVPVLVGIAEIVELCPDRKPNTIYRWRLPRNGKPPELPAPLAIVSRTPVWRLTTVLDLIEAKQLKLDKKALRRILKDQGRSERTWLE